MQAIVLKSSQRKAEGKDTIFRVRGQIVDQSKIDRWQKRSQFRQQDPSHIITTSGKLQIYASALSLELTA